jgi:hypothetical protein
MVSQKTARFWRVTWTDVEQFEQPGPQLVPSGRGLGL